MKKIIFLLVPLLGLLLVVTRFISIKVPPSENQTRPLPCARFGEPQVDVHGREIKTGGLDCVVAADVNQAYLEKVKPIFEEKCLMCHGTVEKVPLYTHIPPVSWLTNADIHEAKEHLDMTHNFPFSSEKEDEKEEGREEISRLDLSKHLEELKEVIDENEMPPLIYKIMHWRSGLSDGEKKIILEWIQASREKLGFQELEVPDS